MTRHLPPDDLLCRHALGEAEEAVSLLIDSHCALVPESARRVSELEALAGAGLEGLEPEPVGDAVWQGLLARLDEPAVAPASAPLPDFLRELELPPPMHRYLSSAKAWEVVLPGFVSQLRPPLDWLGTPVALVRMRPGFVVPQHSHSGMELNLVLSGGFDDGAEEYVRGDIAVKDQTHTHRLDIHADGACVVLVVRQGPLVPVGFAARLASWLTGF